MAFEIDLKMAEIPADKFGYPGMTAQVFYVDYEDSIRYVFIHIRAAYITEQYDYDVTCPKTNRRSYTRTIYNYYSGDKITYWKPMSDANNQSI